MKEMIRRVGQALGAELVRQELAGEDLSEGESNDLLARRALEVLYDNSDIVGYSGYEPARAFRNAISDMLK